MVNSFVLRCTLLFVRLAYYLLPVIKIFCKVLFWGFIGIVTLLLLLLIF